MWYRVLGLGALVLGSPALVLAAGPRQVAPAFQDRGRVELRISARRPVLEATREALSQGFSRLDLEANYRLVEPLSARQLLRLTDEDARSLAYVWLSVQDSRPARLVLVDPARERVIVRLIQVPEGYDRVAVEEVSNIIITSLEALQAGYVVGTSRKEAEATLALYDEVPEAAGRASLTPEDQGRAEDDSASEPDDAGLERSVALYAGTQVLGAGTLVGLFEATVTVLGERLGGALTAGGCVPSEIRSEAAAVLRNCARAFATLRFRLPLASDHHWVGAVGPGIEAAHAQPREGSRQGASLMQPGWDYSAILRVRVGAQLSLGQSWAFLVMPGVEIDLHRTSYVVSQAGQITRFFEPWLVRPTLHLAGSWELP